MDEENLIPNNEINDNNDIYEESSVKVISKNTFFKRTFSKMAVDSQRASIFVLIISSMGTSLFTMHHVLDECGFILGIFFICSILLNYNFSSYMVIDAFKNSLGAKTFTELIEINLGKIGRIFYNGVFGILLCLVVVSVNLSVSKIIFYNIAEWYFQINNEALPIEMSSFIRYCVIGVAFSLFVIVAQKNIDFLGNLTFFSTIFFVLTVIISIIQTPVYYNQIKEKGENDFNLYNTNFEGFFKNIGVLICSFNALISFFTVTNTVRNPSDRRLKKIFSRTFVVLGILYIVGGIVGYCSLGTKNSGPKDLFIFREKYGNSDNFMIISRFLTMIGILVGGALSLFPCKIIVAGTRDMTQKKNIIITLILVCLCALFAAIFQNVTKFLSIAGNFSGTMIGFIYPGLLGLKNNYFKGRPGKIFLYCWIGVMMLYCVSSTIVGIIHFNDPE